MVTSWKALLAETIELSPMEQHNLVNRGLSTRLLGDLVKSFELLNEAEVLSAVGIKVRQSENW